MQASPQISLLNGFHAARVIVLGDVMLDRFIYGLGMRFVGERTAQLLAEHFGMCDRGADVVSDQAIIQGMIIAGSVVEHSRVERSSLVPEARHDIQDQCCASCSAALRAFRSATTSVPVPSSVKTSASKLSGAL